MRPLLLGCALVLTAFGALAQAPSPDPEAVSLFGEPLRPAPLAKEALADREAKLAEARAAVAARPKDPEALIWLGRRTAYLGRYRESIEIFSRGIARHPDDARFYRHRGHRYLTLRRFDLAIADLEKGTRLVAGKPDEVEPDGLPNARNIPTSTLQSNLWYHLGLGYYLTGDFEKALAAYRECLKVSKNPDMLVATSHWLYMTLRRLGREEEARAVLAPIRAGMEILENQAYHRLLLMYRGEVKPEALLAPAAGCGRHRPRDRRLRGRQLASLQRTERRGGEGPPRRPGPGPVGRLRPRRRRGRPPPARAYFFRSPLRKRWRVASLSK